MASPLVKGWIYATVPIENPQGESGTGFLVLRNTGLEQGKVFLVTNKHVICSNPSQRSLVTHIKCHFNTKEPDGSAGTICGDVPLCYPDGSKRFREHVDADTDVIAVDVTDVMQFNPKIEKRWVDYSLFADEAKRKELDITVGEEIVTIGYPLGLRQGESNFPLIRQGMISTKIGTLLADKIQIQGAGLRERKLRAFLIDGATIPGSSGSPVILKPVIGRIQGDAILMGSAPPVLLGIVAETKYAPVHLGATVIPSFAGLGLAFDVETIKETIELFFP
ncbi:MAG: serine protease [Dehalococcoidia bacterium]|nr:MAG: serine protease [Dehalococcoidia bacterium]